MVVSEATVYEHLHKLVVVKSEQELQSLLQLLWRTRKNGLSDPEKSSVQSLLKLPLPGDIDPVLASLRSLIRSCVHENLASDDILKLLPPDLPLELQSMLLISLQTHERQWKAEMSQEQHAIGRTRFSHQDSPDPSAPLLPFSPSDFSGSLLSLQADPVFQLNGHNFGVPTPITTERDVCFPQLSLQNDAAPLEIPGVLPRVKSMTWTVENKGSNIMPANRVAIITLKLQDYSKSPSNEMEVKFQLTKDTLEAVLRSMSYISEQLSRYVGSSAAPLHKKQKL